MLSWLDAERDEAAVFTFDTQARRRSPPFTSGLQQLPDALASMTPFGATSLHDAIAQTAERASWADARRRAVVVLTDGNDNASRLTPSEVSGIASAIDVPVYIIGIVSAIDNPVGGRSATRSRADVGARRVRWPISRHWTGGHVRSWRARRRSAASPRGRSSTSCGISTSSRSNRAAEPGWHPLVVRARDKDLIVRARSGYIAGQSRPISQ